MAQEKPGMSIISSFRVFLLGLPLEFFDEFEAAFSSFLRRPKSSARQRFGQPNSDEHG